MNKPLALLLAAALLAAGCAGQGAVNRDAVSVDAPPRDVAAGEHAGATVNWGGRIIEIRSVDERSEIEVLSFPLDRGGRPLGDRDSDGRFIAVREGFVDPLVYDKDRFVTVVGRIESVRSGTINGQDFRWPVLSVIEMAPAPPPAQRGSGGVTPFFSIGVGIGL